MTDPEQYGTWGGILGGLGTLGFIVMSIRKKWFSDSADIANDRSEVVMIDKLQGLIDKQNQRMDEKDAQLAAKDLQISALIEEKFNYKAQLDAALNKIDILTNKISDLELQIQTLNQAVRGKT